MKLRCVTFICTFCAVYGLSCMVPFPMLLLERFLPSWGLLEIFLLSFYSVFLVTLLNNPKRCRNGRRLAWMVFSVAFFSQLVLGLLGVENMLMTGKLHIPLPAFIVFGPVYRGGFSFMIPLVLIATLLLGSAWCSMLCYFGPLDSFAAGKQPVKTLPPFLQWLLKYGRLLLLCLGITVAILFHSFQTPVEIVLAASFLFVAASLLVIVTLSRKYNSMIHCTAICPFGFLVDVFGKLASWRLAVNVDKCNNCGVCEKVCRYRAISTEARERGKMELQCSLCLDCISVCKKDAISLRSTWFPLSSTAAKRVFLVTLVVVHVVFLAFARV
ncbi:MAG: 4Fe-4S binding protein [Thermoguttaceae bacterium]